MLPRGAMQRRLHRTGLPVCSAIGFSAFGFSAFGFSASRLFRFPAFRLFGFSATTYSRFSKQRRGGLAELAGYVSGVIHQQQSGAFISSDHITSVLPHCLTFTSENYLAIFIFLRSILAYSTIIAPLLVNYKRFLLRSSVLFPYPLRL